MSAAAADGDTVLEVDLRPMFVLDQLAGWYMLANGGGKIINIASPISVIGEMTVPAYAAAKGGVVQLTKTLSNEWAGRRINVNAIIPGFIHTDLTEDLAHDPGEGAQLLARILVTHWGVPDDLNRRRGFSGVGSVELCQRRSPCGFLAR